MSVILILIIASLSLALAFLAGFIWAVKTGQFEDTYTPSMRILLDEQTQRAPEGRSASGKSEEIFLSGGEPKPTEVGAPFRLREPKPSKVGAPAMQESLGRPEVGEPATPVLIKSDT